MALQGSRAIAFWSMNLLLIAVISSNSVRAARLLDATSMNEYAEDTLGDDVLPIHEEPRLAKRSLLQSVPELPSVPSYGYGYYGYYAGYYGGYYPGYGSSPSSPSLSGVVVPGAYGGVNYTKKCEGVGSIIKAEPIDPKNVWLKFTTPVSDAAAEAAADLCERLCVSNDMCKSYYFRTEGKCYLMKGAGKFYGRPVDPSQQVFDTIRSCQITRR